MPNQVYYPRYLNCPIAQGSVHALSFTLPKSSPSYTGTLSAAQYRSIFAQSTGLFGSTLDYAQQTLESLRRLGIEDRALKALLDLAA